MLRVLGWVFGLIGVALLAVDLFETRGGAVRAVGEWWFRLHRDSLQVAQPAIERHVAPWLWGDVIQPFLELPAAPVALALAAVFLLLGRRR